MKILITASNMTHVNNFHLPYIEKFKELGNEVYVLSNGQNADYNIPLEKSVLSLKNFFLIPKIRKILKKENFDVVYTHTTLSAFFVRLAMKGMKKRPYVINTVHGYLFSKETSKLKNKIYLFCEKILKNQTDNIIVMNNEDYEIATKNKLCLDNVYFCNGMGVKFPPLSEKNLANEEKIKLTFVGELSKRKNQSFLVKALKSLPNYMLTLVGDGKERKQLENLAKKLGVQDRLTITGFTKDVYTYLQNTDVYVCASTIEGLPFNIMEAMHAKLPIIASDIKGNNDLLPKESLYQLNNLNDFITKLKNTKTEKVNYDIDKYKLENVLEENVEIYLSFTKKEQNAK